MFAAAKRGDEMNLAVFAYGVQHATGRDLAVDGHGDRRADVAVFE